MKFETFQCSLCSLKNDHMLDSSLFLTVQYLYFVILTINIMMSI